MSATVLCIGIATLDRVWLVDTMPGPGSKTRARAYLEVGGGQAANAAVTAAKLGGRVQLWTAVGSDSAGGKIVDELRAADVDTTGVEVVAGARSITAAVWVDKNGERSIVSDFDPDLLTASSTADLDAIASANAVLADVKWPAGAEPALQRARSLGIPTVLDIEPAPAGNLERLCPLADHAIFGQSGLAAFTGTDDPLAGLRIAHARLAGIVGVTLGAQGIRLMTSAGETHVPARRVAVVDTTGAGDAFHGAYALAIAEGRDAVAAAGFANAVAAMKCTKAGGRAGLPTRTELERFMETHT